MPVTVKKIGDKWRIVGPEGSIETTADDNPRDGGGHNTYEEAMAQMKAINMHLSGEVKK